MRSLNAFNFITLDGYYKGLDNDISWHKHGGEEAEYSAQSLGADNILLFGRITYEMMYGFWSTQMAYDTLPVVAEGMNKADKIVFSNTLKKAEWQNTRLINGNIIEEIKSIKNQSGKNMTILGSGTIITQFAQAGLLDELEIMIDPVAIGRGTSVFKDLTHPVDFKLTSTRTFKSGVVLLSYKVLPQ